MVGRPGRSGVGATEARLANRQARMAAIMERRRQDGELDAGQDLQALDLEAVDASGNVIPKPSARVDDYPDGETGRQLAWGRYIAGCQRAVALQTELRQRIRIEDVQEWCARVAAVINRRLPSLQALPDSLPAATDEQRTWLRTKLVDWDRTYREEVAREVIE